MHVAFLSLQNMTGAQFDSAAQAQFQQHDRYKLYDDAGREIASPSPATAASSSAARGAAPPLPSYSASDLPHAPSATNSTNLSLHLLDKYGSHAVEDSRGQPSPRVTTANAGEPKTHDRRL